jgi:hypothetical protein
VSRHIESDDVVLSTDILKSDRVIGLIAVKDK